MSTMPTVPDISTQQQGPAVVAAPSGVGEEISALLGRTAEQANTPLPPQYVQGTDIAQPHIKPVVPYTPQETNHQPLSNQATSLIQARKQNAAGSLANLIGKAGQNIQMQKQERLKDDLVTVMKAKTNVANAQAVLQQDPNNKIAQGVLAANKKSLEAILSDPKKQKQLAKALDISYVDPSKNKTPEVQAFQQATAEIKKAGPFNSDNPQEHQVAQQAANPKPQASQTPRADAALSKDMPTVQQNPQYQAALAQQQAAQKQLTQYVIPRMVAAESAKQVQLIKDQNAGARAEFGAVTKMQQEQQKNIDALKLQNTKASDALKLQANKDAQAFARTKLHVDAMLKVADDKRLDKATTDKMKQDSLETIDKDFKGVSDTSSKLSTQIATLQQADPKNPDIATLKTALDNNNLRLNALGEYRNRVQEKVYGKTTPISTTTKPESQSKDTGSSLISRLGLDVTQVPEYLTKGTINGSDKSIESVGAGESDESDDDDSDTNSDDYGTSDGK